MNQQNVNCNIHVMVRVKQYINIRNGTSHTTNFTLWNIILLLVSINDIFITDKHC